MLDPALLPLWLLAKEDSFTGVESHPPDAGIRHTLEK
jgi:hypothetical protein